MYQIKISNSITRRDCDSVNKYLSDVSQTALITPDHEAELARRIHKGDQKALSELVNSNLRFVISVAKTFQNSGLPLSDLIQEGNIGLIKAAQKYDETKGFRFISYAVWWIRQQIMQSIADQTQMVRVPMNHIEMKGKINKIANAFEREHGYAPDTEYLAEKLDTDVEKIKDEMSITGDTSSLDATLTNDSESTFADFLESEDTDSDKDIMKDSLRKEIDSALKNLRKEGLVLKKFYGIGCQPMSLDEIAEEMNLSRERVRQIKQCAIKKLKKSPVVNSLRPYLG